MKNLMTAILLILVFNSCKTDNISNIKINVKSVQTIDATPNIKLFPKLEVELSSKSNITSITTEESISSTYIFCPLDSDNFSPNNISVEKYKLYGAFPQDIVGNFNTQDSTYNYSLKIGFVDKDYNLLNRDVVSSIISEKECIECKIVFSYFPSRIKQNSFSDTFCIPVDKLEHGIKE